MASAMPSTGNRHFRNYPLTGHIADMAESTRMTHMRHRQVAQQRVSEPTLGPFQSASLRRYDVLS